MNTKSLPTTEYAVIWFEGEETYTLVNSSNQTVILSRAEAYQDTAGVINTEDDLENAEDDLRYAISTDLLEDLFGWDSYK